MAAFNWGNAWDRVKGVAAGAWNDPQAYAGKAWGKTQEYAGKGWDAAQGIPGAVWNAEIPVGPRVSDIVTKQEGRTGAIPIGKIGTIGVGGLAGTRFVAYPLVSGALPSELRQDIGQNPVTSFVTGQDPYDPSLMRDIQRDYIDQERGRVEAYNQAEQQRMMEVRRQMLDEDQRRQIAATNELNNLRYGLGSRTTFRDLYANQLMNSTSNYLNSMTGAAQEADAIFRNAAAIRPV
jgi:hypothetical protein